MLIKKLAVPLINDKILIQTEHCYIATAAISETAFDFVKGRLSPQCKIDIVTGLDILTSPQVLRRVWRHYQDRITLNIYTRNPFHANVYIFDLPYKKSVAFVGSGNLTMEGLKDHEEIFYKITDPKEIEALMSWYTGYFEFSEPLTETIIQEYELIYPIMKQREIASQQEKKQMITLTTGGFNWDHIKFKNQYFKKEDYLTFGNNRNLLDAEENRSERLVVHNKLLAFHNATQGHFAKHKFFSNANAIVSSLDLKDHDDKRLRSMWITYGRSEAELNKQVGTKLANFMSLKIIISQKDLGISLVVGRKNEDRVYFQSQMQMDEEYRSAFFKLLTALGVGYWIEIAGDTKMADSFQNPDVLWNFIKADQDMHFVFIIGKNYSPGDAQISNENINDTIMLVGEKLSLLYKHLRNR